MAILECHNSVTPEPIDKKIDTRDCVSDLTSYAKFHNIRRDGVRYTPVLYQNG